MNSFDSRLEMPRVNSTLRVIRGDVVGSDRARLAIHALRAASVGRIGDVDRVLGRALGRARPREHLAVRAVRRALIARAGFSQLHGISSESRRVELKPLVAARIALEHEALRTGNCPRGRDRLALKRDLRACAARRGHAMNLLGGAEARRDEDRAVGEPVLEGGGAIVLVALHGRGDVRGDLGDVLQSRGADLACGDGGRSLREGAGGADGDGDGGGEQETHDGPSGGREEGRYSREKECRAKARPTALQRTSVVRL